MVFQMSLEAVEALVPEPAVRLDPGVDLAERLRPEPVARVAGRRRGRPRVPSRAARGGASRRRADSSRAARPAHRPLTVAQQVEDAAASRFGEELESSVARIVCLGQLYACQVIDRGQRKKRPRAVLSGRRQGGVSPRGSGPSRRRRRGADGLPDLVGLEGVRRAGCRRCVPLADRDGCGWRARRGRGVCSSSWACQSAGASVTWSVKTRRCSGSTSR